jgi:hypothetical protein
MSDMLLNSTAGRCRPPQKLLDFRGSPVLPQRVALSFPAPRGDFRARTRVFPL